MAPTTLSSAIEHACEEIDGDLISALPGESFDKCQERLRSNANALDYEGYICFVSLPMLKRVTGSVLIHTNENIGNWTHPSRPVKNLDALDFPALEFVGGAFKAFDGPAYAAANGDALTKLLSVWAPKLVSVGSNVTIWTQETMSFDCRLDLGQLKTVQGNFEYAPTCRLKGFNVSSLANVGGNFMVVGKGTPYHLVYVTKMDLPRLVTVGGMLMIGVNFYKGNCGLNGLNCPEISVEMPELIGVGKGYSDRWGPYGIDFSCPLLQAIRAPKLQYVLGSANFAMFPSAIGSDNPVVPLSTTLDVPSLHTVEGTFSHTYFGKAVLSAQALATVGGNLRIKPDGKGVCKMDIINLPSLKMVAGFIEMNGNLFTTSIELPMLEVVKGDEPTSPWDPGNTCHGECLGFQVLINPKMERLLAPKLASVEGAVQVIGTAGYMNLPPDALSMINMDALARIADFLEVSFNVQLAQLSLPSLESVGGDFKVIRNNASLTCVDAPKLDKSAIGGQVFDRVGAGLCD